MSEVKMEKVSIRRIMEIIHDPQNMLEHGRRDYWYNQIHLILEKAFADQRTAVLTKLREGVEGLKEWTGNDAENRTEPALASGFYYDREDIDALIEKLEAGE